MTISCLKSLHSQQLIGTEALLVQDWLQCSVKCSDMWLFSLCLSLHLHKPNQGFSLIGAALKLFIITNGRMVKHKMRHFPCVMKGSFFLNSVIHKVTSVHANVLYINSRKFRHKH